MTPLEIVAYYADLLILQYKAQPKAYATIATTVAPIVMPQTSTQDINFSAVAASGSFILSYDESPTPAIQWNDTALTIQGYLQSLPGLGSVTVSGSIADQSLSVLFTDTPAPAQLLVVSSNVLLDGASDGIEIEILETDQTLPLAVQDAFNLTGPSPAKGVQLDILGKYVGVTRSGNGINGPITLDDDDFLTLIKFAIVQNNSGSSLGVIEENLNRFFPGQFLVTDYQNMHMSYILSQSLGSSNLFSLLVSEGLLPRPMTVQISVIIPPSVSDFFGFSTYNGLNNFVKPFNTYDDFNTDWIWLSYDDAIIA